MDKTRLKASKDYARSLGTTSSPTSDLDRSNLLLVRSLMKFGPRSIRKLSRLVGTPYTWAIEDYRRMRNRLGVRVVAAPNTGLLG